MLLPRDSPEVSIMSPPVFPESAGSFNNLNERDKELEGLASLGYLERLTHFARGSTRHRVKDSITVVDFRPLYAITVHHLQKQLAQEIHLLTKEEITDLQLTRIEELVKRYSNSRLRPSSPPFNCYLDKKLTSR